MMAGGEGGEMCWRAGDVVKYSMQYTQTAHADQS
jgi:hypothetical protein